MKNAQKLFEVWGNRIAGTAAALGAIYGFITNALDVEIFLVGRFISAAGFALAGAIAAGIVLLPVFIIVEALVYSSEEKNPFAQGVRFIFATTTLLLMFGSTLDYALTGGVLLIEPALKLITEGTLEGTIYECDNYVTDGYMGGCID